MIEWRHVMQQLVPYGPMGKPIGTSSGEAHLGVFLKRIAHELLHVAHAIRQSGMISLWPNVETLEKLQFQRFNTGF